MTDDMMTPTELIEAGQPYTHADLCLRFPDEATATEALTDLHAAIDVIGTIYKPTGEMLLGEDGEYPEMAPLEGWHVNLRGVFTADDLDALELFVVTPENPVRVWA